MIAFGMLNSPRPLAQAHNVRAPTLMLIEGRLFRESLATLAEAGIVVGHGEAQLRGV